MARAGNPRSESARERPRLLPARRLRGEPRPPAARLLGRHRGAESFTLYDQGPDHRRRAERDASATSRQRGLGQRQPHAVLRRARRRASPLPALPPPARRQLRRTMRWCYFETGRVVLPRHRPHPEPGRTCLSSSSSHSTSEVRFVSADRPEEPFDVVEPRRPGIEYSVSHHGEPVLHHHQRRRAQLPTGQRSGMRPLEEPTGLRSCPTVPTSRSTAPTPSAIISWCTSAEAGLRQIRVLDLASTRRRAPRSPSPSRSTPSGSTRIPSSTPRCSASPTPRW